MLTVLACVRTPDAARAIAVCADRLGVSASVRTATTAVEAIARLAERCADLIFVDGPLTHPDSVGFVRRALAYAPRATLVVYGLPEPSVASALIAAGARGVIRGGDTDLVTAVTKTVLLLGLTDGVGIGAVVGSMNGSAAAVNATVAARTNGRRSAVDTTLGTDVRGADVRGTDAHSADMHGPDTHRTPGRPIAPGKVNGPADRPSPSDTRNGGPGFTTPRPPAPDPIDVAMIRANGDDLRTGLPPSLVPQQRADLLRPPGLRTPTLTERELQVLRGMSDGKSNAEIGRELFVSEDTVKTHARRLFRKLGARDRAHAVASGFRLGLVG